MSRRIIVLAALGVALTGYLIFFQDRDDMIYFFGASLIVLALSYIYQHQIDQLSLRGVPQRLDPAMRAMLEHTSAQFRSWPEAERQMAEDRMKRWVLKKDFIQKNDQAAPEDVNYILAFYAILLTIHQESFLYDGLDRIAYYHHPFLTPNHPDDVHIAEVEAEDGTMIISVPHVLKGHLEKGYYNIALHAMAEAYKIYYIKSDILWPSNIWAELEAISGMSRDQIEAYIGLPQDDPWPVAVHHQVMFSNARIPEVSQVLYQLAKQ